MKKPLFILTSVFLSAAMLSGCCLNPFSLAGKNIDDLKKARSEGVSKIVQGSVSEVFDKVKAKLENNLLKVYQADKKKGYIIAMDFKKQVNTTRVGIFFEPQGENQTKITLSSLSNTCLKKAEELIFHNL